MDSTKSCALCLVPGSSKYKGLLWEDLGLSGTSCDTLMIGRTDFKHDHFKWRYRQSTMKIYAEVKIYAECTWWMPQYSLSSVSIPLCESLNRVAEWCQRTDLRCRMLVPVQAWVSKYVSCVGKREYVEKGQWNIRAGTWQSTNPRVASILPTAIISLCARQCALSGRFQSRDYFSTFHLDFRCSNSAMPTT